MFLHTIIDLPTKEYFILYIDKYIDVLLKSNCPRECSWDGSIWITQGMHKICNRFLNLKEQMWIPMKTL